MHACTWNTSGGYLGSTIATGRYNSISRHIPDLVIVKLSLAIMHGLQLHTPTYR